MTPRLLLSLALASTSALAVACGSSAPPPPKTSGPSTSGKPRKAEKAPEMDAEIGALDERQVTKTFERLMASIDRCQDDRRKTDGLDFLSGDVEVELKIDKSGRVAESRLTTTTIGDRGTERCILAALRGADWPKPQGGRHGVARSSFQLPMKGDRDAVAWDAAKVSGELAKARSALTACTKGKRATVTMYVDTAGKVLAVGVAGLDDGASDCVAAEAARWKLPSPGGWPAKVTFTVD